MIRFVLSLAILAGTPTLALAEDWGMGNANSRIPPSHIFDPVSTPAIEIDKLAFFVLTIAGVIFVIVAGVLAWGVVKYRHRAGDDRFEPPQVYGSNPIEFAWTTVPVLIIFVLILITARTIFSVQAAVPPPQAVKVRVIGHQWWWEFQYPELGVVTANELHVPLSKPGEPTPTFLDLESADVAHSFWIPRLAGKTDVIPNKKNTMWIEPHQFGTYLGQCAEFCGTEHALMLIRVVVEPRERFDRWVSDQRKPLAADASVARGREIFESTACINCHTVRGTNAQGRFGPDLTHLASRETIGSGAAMNTRAHLKIWMHDPGVMKPGALMPAMNLDDTDLDALLGFLESLR